MTTLRTMAEAKKAAIRREAELREAEVDAELKQIEELAAKYGLMVLPPPPQAPSTSTPVPAPPPPARPAVSLMTAIGEVARNMERAIAAAHATSTTAKARAAAEAYIRSKNRPVPLGELFEVLEKSGIKFEGETARNTLSAILGQTPTLYSISRGRGWWLKGVPEPEGVFE